MKNGRLPNNRRIIEVTQITIPNIKEKASRNYRNGDFEEVMTTEPVQISIEIVYEVNPQQE